MTIAQQIALDEFLNGIQPGAVCGRAVITSATDTPASDCRVNIHVSSSREAVSKNQPMNAIHTPPTSEPARNSTSPTPMST